MVRLVLVVVLFGGAVALADEKKPEPKKADKVVLSADLEEILKLTNAAWAKKKLAPLTIDPMLCQVALDYSKLMAAKNKLAHQLDGKKVGERLLAVGYDCDFAGENVACAI